MARTPTGLANAALTLLVRDTIRNLDGSSPAAIQTKANWEATVQEVIEEYDWPSHRVVAPLLRTEDVPLRGWTYSYIIPPDMIKIWGVADSQNLIRSAVSEPYEMGMSPDTTKDTTYIFTNVAGAYIRYGSSRGSLARTTPLLFELMSIKLALKCCMSLTKNINLLNKLDNLYVRKLSAVKTLTINSEPEVIDTDFIPELIRVRSE